MPPVGFSLSVQGAEQYKNVARKLRQTGRTDLRKRLRDKIKDAGGPVLDEVKSAVEHLRVTSTYQVTFAGRTAVTQHRYRSSGHGAHGGGRAQRRVHAVAKAKTARKKAATALRPHDLRRAVARATKLEITNTGVRFVVRSNLLPEGQRKLPRHLDSEKGWRHPLFGHGPWFAEKGSPWFGETIKKKAPAFRRVVLEAMQEVSDEIAK